MYVCVRAVKHQWINQSINQSINQFTNLGITYLLNNLLPRNILTNQYNYELEIVDTVEQLDIDNGYI